MSSQRGESNTVHVWKSLNKTVKCDNVCIIINSQQWCVLTLAERFLWLQAEIGWFMSCACGFLLIWVIISQITMTLMWPINKAFHRCHWSPRFVAKNSYERKEGTQTALHPCGSGVKPTDRQVVCKVQGWGGAWWCICVSEHGNLHIVHRAITMTPVGLEHCQSAYRDPQSCGDNSIFCSHRPHRIAGFFHICQYSY